MAGRAMLAIAVSSEAIASAVKIAATAQRRSSGGKPSMGAGVGSFAVVSSDIRSGLSTPGGGRAHCGVYYGRGTSHRHTAA